MAPPEYHLESFWDERFGKENHFEWLGDGQQTILPVLRDTLNTHAPSSNQQKTEQEDIPRLLHIGAGTSTLSDDIINIYREKFGNVKEATVLNTDFSKTAIERGNMVEEARGSRAVRWERADMLAWEDVKVLVKGSKDDDDVELFKIVVEKSTSDAISCAEDIVLQPLKPSTSSIFPLLQSYLARQPHLNFSIQPMKLLSLHLAAVVAPNGVWLALSYSQERFQFLAEQEGKETQSEICPSLYWRVEGVRGVDAPSGQEAAGVYTPRIQHYVYVLRRTEIRIDLAL
ncbi:hypothetical protein NLI96_g3027 [Meripilus lineatus]|uniref:Uncharacterized protein n=1 Tax=Meripilus lineatus TaxID=2056292 RepID=A0AAD5V7Q4_9APHY|nr:hypothetical protein NLI96_g3027 [Physisporinus lineatus]